ncbi:hypothetical protein [Phenylobacterium deserti]|uniref:Uncharacterized protein n=1 Tax=Phenylobacterium deserti TaxID=1914756 RepID=A0A328AQU3_9CAUL|nr:hypothetical protein [Phenylobacterium deserti]RAK56665.1 hypothetical protein DJ018_01410 [Phenylobacterium deserti]
MSEFLFYGLDEAGQTAFSERLQGSDTEALRTLARERLSRFHTVEIWQGPLCIVRLRRKAAEQA